MPTPCKPGLISSCLARGTAMSLCLSVESTCIYTSLLETNGWPHLPTKSQFFKVQGHPDKRPTPLLIVAGVPLAARWGSRCGCRRQSQRASCVGRCSVARSRGEGPAPPGRGACRQRHLQVRPSRDLRQPSPAGPSSAASRSAPLPRPRSCCGRGTAIWIAMGMGWLVRG